MRLLIIGHLGNLGVQLIKAFQDDYEVIGWDREDLDITKKDRVLERIEFLKPEIIINAAAYNAVDKCESDEEEFELAQKINGLAPGYLAEAALKVGALLVHYSTDYVFKGDKEEGYKEDDLPEPINRYGYSKLMGEEAIKKFVPAGLKYYLIRTSKLFGPAGRSNVAKPSFFDLMSSLAKDREELKVVDEELSCFTYTKDLAQKTREIIESKEPFGLYHISNSQPATWYEALKECFKIRGIYAKIIAVGSSEFPRPANRPKCSILLNSKLKPLRSYVEALKESSEEEKNI